MTQQKMKLFARQEPAPVETGTRPETDLTQFSNPASGAPDAPIAENEPTEVSLVEGAIVQDLPPASEEVPDLGSQPVVLTAAPTTDAGSLPDNKAAYTFGARFKRSFLNLATGGDWAYAQSPNTRRSLVWFWFDGLFASASDNIVNTYLVIYLLALGATQAQIGVMSSLSSLTAAAMLMPGALLVERIGRRRNIVLAGGGLSRLGLLLLALLPLFVQGPALIPVAIAISLLRDAGGNISYPAWMSLTADIVPLEGRGRYFASRNFIMGLMGMATTFMVGLLLTYTVQPGGYQTSLALAFVFGLLAVFSFGHIYDAQHKSPARAPVSSSTRQPSLLALLKEIGSHREFAGFAGITALWNVSLNVAGPFFNVYMVQNLKADAAMVAITAIASSLAAMLVQRKLGELNDRWGSRRLTILSGLLIPFVPAAWLFIDSPVYIIPINLASGALWGAYNMGSFNYLLSVCPETRRARYSAIFQIVVTLSLAVGAALGSLLVSQWGYLIVFGVSAAGRLVTALLFAIVSRGKRNLAQGSASA